MSTNDGGAAFPGLDHSPGVGLVQREPGMSLRDYFAATAIPVLIQDRVAMASFAAIADATGRCATEVMSRTAYAIADAMIAERTRE